MMKSKILGISTALVIGSSSAVMAQDDLAGFFDGISGMATQSGGIVSFSERNIGADNSVEYTDLFISAPDGEVVIAADWLKAVPSVTTPGQVTFTLSPVATITVNDDSFPAPLVLNISNTGLVIIADGLTGGQDVDILNYSIRADMFSVIAETGGNPFLRALDFTFENLAEDFSISPATMEITNSGSFSGASYNYDFTTPEQDDMSGSGALDSLEYSLGFFAVGEERLFEYLSGGLNAFFEMTMGESTGTSGISSAEMNLVYSGTSTGGIFNMRMENGRFTMTQVSGPTDYSFTKINIGGMPIPPFDMTSGDAEIDISIPFTTNGDFEPATFLISIKDLAVSESLLSIVDPGQVIARDPINMVIDLAANIKANIDWTNPDASFTSGNPDDIGEIKDISINEISFGAFGATLLANGSAVIDSSMGFPFPTGSVTVTLSGIQTLANGLVELGLIPAEQVGMGMGMMMAFARPGDMADQFVSEIEFSPQGITANGTPLPF